MRLPGSLRLSLYAVGSVVAASGIAWLLGRYVAPAVIGRSFAALSMEVHGGAAMLLLVLIGGAVALHTPAGWRDGKNRASGTVVATALSVLTVTGYFLYYLGDEHARSAASVAHWGLGLAAPLLLCVHVWQGRRSTQS